MKPSRLEPSATTASTSTFASKTHPPERSLFERTYEWVDLLPWLRLIRVCRVAGGPVWLTHVVACAVVWLIGIEWMFQRPWDGLDVPLLATVQPTDPLWLEIPPGGEPGRSMPWLPISWLPLTWLAMIWTLVVWLPTSMALLRVGAILTAGRDMPSYLSTFRIVLRRLISGLVVMILPLLCCLPFLLAILVTNAIVAVTGGAVWADWLVLPIALPSVVVIGLFVAGAKPAIPLALAAIMIEPAADPIDSLSRGFEYTLRRLPQLVFLVMVAALITCVVVGAFVAIEAAGSTLMMRFSPSLKTALRVVDVLPEIVATMMLWSMSGGVYLLLRQSAGGQEVEDILLEEDRPRPPELPPVGRQPSGDPS